MTAAQRETGRHGGTLRLYGPAALDHVDPAAAPGGPAGPAGQITRLFARGLFGYRAEPDLRDWRAIAPQADLATNVPSTYNTGMGARHLNYVVHLRRGVYWDTTPPREVTTHDVVRGLKRMCNPVTRPATIGYFTSTIRGMAEFCDDYAAAVPGGDPSAAALAAFQNSHDIPGVFVLDEESLVIELARPALDFVDIMALPCAAPAPVEYDAFVPDSPELRRNLRSNGPYRIVHHVPGRELRLEPNPVWRQDTDPLRARHLDAVEVTMERATPVQIAAKIDAGLADLAWGAPVTEPYDTEPADPGDGLGYALDPYLVFNLASASAVGAADKANAVGAPNAAGVRRAISCAIDKAAIAELVREHRTGTVVRIAHSIIPPGNDGHTDDAATPGDEADRGDPDRSRALLAEAGYPDGLTLTAAHGGDGSLAIIRSCAADLEKAGISLRLVALDPATLRDGAPGTGWDLALASWAPAWFHTNGRVFLQPLFQSAGSRRTANLGHYADPAVDALIEQALAVVEEPGRSDAAWREAERRILADAAVVPILFQKPVIPPLTGSRVRNAISMPAFGHSVDLAALWLDPPE